MMNTMNNIFSKRETSVRFFSAILTLPVLQKPMTKMQSWFKKCNAMEDTNIEVIASHFGVEYERIPQTFGVCGDFSLTTVSSMFENEFPGYLTLELKADYMARRTGNVYFEYSHTNDDFFTEKVSGHKKAIEQGCLLVITVAKEYFFLTIDSYERLMQARSYRDVVNSRNINGNPNGCRNRGYLVPVKVLRDFCAYSFEV